MIDIEHIVTELEDASSISSVESLEQIRKCTTDRLLSFQKVATQGKIYMRILCLIDRYNKK